jgi:hypothetical protein
VFNASRTEQLDAGIVLPPAAARIAADAPDQTAAQALERTGR